MSTADDLAEISAVIYRYSTAMDERQWQLMDDVFIEDAAVDMGGYLFPRGRAQIVHTIRAAIECCASTHHMNSNIEAGIAGDTARVTNKFRAWHRGKGTHQRVVFEALGNYSDEFVRTPAGWRIKHRTERSPIEILSDSTKFGGIESFFADAMEAFAAVSKRD